MGVVVHINGTPKGEHEDDDSLVVLGPPSRQENDGGSSGLGRLLALPRSLVDWSESSGARRRLYLAVDHHGKVVGCNIISNFLMHRDPSHGQ
jgi:hypothetical protein